EPRLQIAAIPDSLRVGRAQRPDVGGETRPPRFDIKHARREIREESEPVHAGPRVSGREVLAGLVAIEEGGEIDACCRAEGVVAPGPRVDVEQLEGAV